MNERADLIRACFACEYSYCFAAYFVSQAIAYSGWKRSRCFIASLLIYFVSSHRPIQG